MPSRDRSPRVGIPPKVPGEREPRFTSAARRAAALKKLGVSLDQVASAPQVTALLREIGGSRRAILEALRFSEKPVVERFLAKHDSLGVWGRTNTPWEAIALAAGIDPEHLLGAAMMAQREHTMMRTKFIAFSHCVEVMKKRIEFAMLPGGWRDRDALDKFLGLLPVE